MRRKNDNLFRLAFCALCAGASVAAMWLGAVSGIFDLSSLLFAGTLTVVMRIEGGDRFAWAGVAAASVVALLFLPEKLLAIGYIAVGGAYPMLMRFLPKRGAIAWALRAAIGAALVGLYFLAIKFIFVGEYDVGETFLYPVIAVGGVIVFIMYDRWLGLFSRFYVNRIRPRIGIDRFRRGGPQDR